MNLFSDFLNLIFAVRSSHWQQRTGLALGVTSEIYLLERVLRGRAAMVTSERRGGGALPSKDL